MNNLKSKIQNNLYLRVDYNYSFKTKSGNLGKDVKFYIIGVLPVLVEYGDGQKERASVNSYLVVKKDPMLRTLHGQRVGNFKKVEKFKKEIIKIIEKLEKSFIKIMDSKSFNKKAIKNIYIINLEKNVKRGGNKN